MGNVWQITQVSLHPAYQEGCFASLEKGFRAYLSRQNDVVNAHDIVPLSFRYFHPPPFSYFYSYHLTFFTFESLSFSFYLFVFFVRIRSPIYRTLSSFAFQRMEFDRLARPSSVTRDETTSFFISSREKSFLRDGT